MAKKDKPVKEKAIAKRPAKPLARPEKSFTVAALEKALLKEFPREDAESWDVMGLTVGEGAIPANKVAVALDPTVEAIRKASAIGANVLITHHPPFLEGPMQFSPEDSVALSPGAAVWAAIQNRVALMNFHTALDVSKRAQMALPQILGFKATGQVLEPIATSKRKGYGQICAVAGQEDTLSHIASRCVASFGRAPKVWGDWNKSVKKVVTALGSVGDLGKRALAADFDLLVCGEIKYHAALDLSQAGLAIIELGHDVSELPLAAVLAKTVADVGFPKGEIAIIDQSNNWAYPETIRL